VNTFQYLFKSGFFNAFAAGFATTLGTFFLLGGSYGLGAALLLLAVLNIALAVYNA